MYPISSAESTSYLYIGISCPACSTWKVRDKMKTYVAVLVLEVGD